jgi:hypothetical protein
VSAARATRLLTGPAVNRFRDIAEREIPIVVLEPASGSTDEPTGEAR